jgi:hypothetical protein
MTPPLLSPPPPSARRLWFWLVGLSLLAATPPLLLAGAGWLAWREVARAEPAVRELRDRVVAASGDAWLPMVEGRAGGLVLGAARLAARAADVPPEVADVLGLVRGGSVCVLQPRPSSRPADPAAVLEAARAAGGGAGWEPVVTVRDGGEVVLVLVREAALADGTLEARVVVAADGHLVIAAAAVDAERLLAAAERLMARHDPPGLCFGPFTALLSR